jgi:signal transduction histidine kinase
MEVSTSPLRNSGGEIIGAISDIRDITRRKRMEEQMVRVDKLASLGELSSGMAHEIRNPLAGMKTSAQVLVDKLTQGPEQVLVRGILSEINRINGIVTDLLNFSRPNPSLPAPVPVAAILNKTQSLVMEKIRMAGIKILRNEIPHPCQAMVDQEQIQQVFLNLMLNAVKSMPDGGCLEISTEFIDGREAAGKYPVPEFLKFSEKKGYILVSFKDSGCGISRENLSKVFNPFYTTDPSGTGLGLSIVQKLLEKNSGAIHIDSTLGRGTHVTILLPTAVFPGSLAEKSQGTENPVQKGTYT